MIQQFDFHMHTTFSDGQYSVDELVKKVREAGVKFFSITDHDSIESIKKIKNCDISGMEYIPGVEVSSILDDKYKVHLLGYYIDENNTDLINVLEILKEKRKARFRDIAKHLEKDYGLSIKEKDIDSVLKTVNVPGKVELAKLLLDYGYVSSVPEAFEKYLEGIKASVSNRLPADLVIKTIKNAGGKVMLAHPKKVEKKYGINFEEVMPRLLELGLDGIEVFNSLHSYDDSIRYLEYAKKKGLLISGGSDYHGDKIKPSVKIGVVYNTDENIKIDISEIIIRKEDKNE